MTRLTEDPTKEHKTAVEAGNEENSKHMSSIPDHGLVPPVRAGACRAHPAKEAPDREEAARRQSWKRSCLYSLCTFTVRWVNSEHRTLNTEAHCDCYCHPD